jgi:hypothetical protein
MRTTKYGLQTSDMSQRDEVELELKLRHHDTEQNNKNMILNLLTFAAEK